MLDERSNATVANLPIADPVAYHKKQHPISQDSLWCVGYGKQADEEEKWEKQKEAKYYIKLVTYHHHKSIQISRFIKLTHELAPLRHPISGLFLVCSSICPDLGTRLLILSNEKKLFSCLLVAASDAARNLHTSGVVCPAVLFIACGILYLSFLHGID